MNAANFAPLPRTVRKMWPVKVGPRKFGRKMRPKKTKSEKRVWLKKSQCKTEVAKFCHDDRGA